MEILFENSHIREKQLFKETGFYAFFRRPFAMIANIVAILCIIINIPLLFLKEDRAFHIFMIFVGVLIILCGILGYHKYVKTWYTREVEPRATNGTTTYTIEVYEDKLVHCSTLGTRQELELSRIKKVVKTKSYILLQSNANLMYVFDKNGFTKGTLEEFLEFLRGKKLYK